MITTIVKKEILGSIREPRFILGWLLILILLVSSVILLSEDVRQRREQQQLAQKSREEIVSKYSHINRVEYLLEPTRPIEQSESLVRGLDNISEEKTFFSRPLIHLFAHLDLVYILAVLMSLLAIIFTYNSICGEREQGTLKLLHTTPVSRFSVVLAKWLSSTLIILVPLLASVFLVLLAGSLSGGIHLTLDLLVDILLILLAGSVYVGFFTALGIAVSATLKTSGAAILTLLFLWVVFVLAIPNASPILASQISPIPSVNEVERETRALTDVIRDNRISEEDKTIIAEYRRKENIPASVTNLRDIEQYIAAGWTEQRAQSVSTAYVETWRVMAYRINDEQRAKANAIRDELDRKIEKQQMFAKGISLTSPTSAFTYFATDVASVGLRAEDYYLDERKEHLKELRDYVEQHWKDEEKRVGKTIGYDDYLDVSGRPVFQHKPAPLRERLSGVLIPAGILVLFALIALTLAAVMYLRYDIR